MPSYCANIFKVPHGVNNYEEKCRYQTDIQNVKNWQEKINL